MQVSTISSVNSLQNDLNSISLEKSFNKAIQELDFETVKECISQGVDPNSKVKWSDLAIAHFFLEQQFSESVEKNISRSKDQILEVILSQIDSAKDSLYSIDLDAEKEIPLLGFLLLMNQEELAIELVKRGAKTYSEKTLSYEELCERFCEKDIPYLTSEEHLEVFSAESFALAFGRSQFFQYLANHHLFEAEDLNLNYPSSLPVLHKLRQVAQNAPAHIVEYAFKLFSPFVFQIYEKDFLKHMVALESKSELEIEQMYQFCRAAEEGDEAKMLSIYQESNGKMSQVYLTPKIVENILIATQSIQFDYDEDYNPKPVAFKSIDEFLWTILQQEAAGFFEDCNRLQATYFLFHLQFELKSSTVSILDYAVFMQNEDLFDRLIKGEKSLGSDIQERRKTYRRLLYVATQTTSNKMFEKLIKEIKLPLYVSQGRRQRVADRREDLSEDIVENTDCVFDYIINDKREEMLDLLCQHRREEVKLYFRENKADICRYKGSNCWKVQERVLRKNSLNLSELVA